MLQCYYCTLKLSQPVEVFLELHRTVNEKSMDGPRRDPMEFSLSSYFCVCLCAFRVLDVLLVCMGALLSIASLQRVAVLAIKIRWMHTCCNLILKIQFEMAERTILKINLLTVGLFRLSTFD